MSIAPGDRTLAALTHLSGLSGYVFPLGGVIVPIIIWVVKSEEPVVSSIAKQAVILFWFALGIVAVALPVIGALKANQGEYYRYPVVGIAPDAAPAR